MSLNIEILYIFDTAEIKLLKFHQPSHTSIHQTDFINPVLYLKSSLTSE